MPVQNKKSVLLYVSISVVIIILLNVIARNWFFRWDLTDNKMYSLSESSKTVVQKVDDLLTLKVYFTDNLPGDYANNRRYLQDILEEYAAYSDGNIRFEFYAPASEEKLAEEAQKAGIMPVQLQVIENDKMEIKKVYMGMQLLYEDRKEVIPLIQSTTGLEYEITTKIKRLVESEKRTVAFATFDGQTVKNQTLTDALGEAYTVRRLSLNRPIPENISCLLVNGVQDSVPDEELKNLQDFLDRGGNLVMAQNRIDTDLQKQRATPIQSNIFSFLEKNGINLQENLVLDRRSGQVTITQNRGFFRMNSAVDYPFFPLIRSFGDHPTVAGLEQIQILFPSELTSALTDTTDQFLPLFITSDHSGIMTGSYNLGPLNNPAFQMMNQTGKTVAALVSMKQPSTGQVSQMILIGDSRFFDDSGSGGIPENAVFIHNAVDYLMGDSELVALRSREITTRPLDELTDEAKARIKWMNILLPPLLIIGLGIFRWKKEANRSEKIEEIYG
ncbi:MAG: GldG family protein, partial [Fidelibacterota bacterium]